MQLADITESELNFTLFYRQAPLDTKIRISIYSVVHGKTAVSGNCQN